MNNKLIKALSESSIAGESFDKPEDEWDEPSVGLREVRKSPELKRIKR